MSSAQSTVREVKLRLRIPASAERAAPTLRVTAERTFLRGVLDALELAIHERLGPRAIVRIKHLPLRWRLGESELGDRAVHLRLGAELADSILQDAAVPRVRADGGSIRRSTETMPRPSPRAQMAVFADDAHAIAVAIADRAEGRPAAYYHPASTVEELWQQVLAAGEDTIAAVVELLRAYLVDLAVLDVATTPPLIRARLRPPRAHHPALPLAASTRDRSASPDPVRSAPSHEATSHDESRVEHVAATLDAVRANGAVADALTPVPIATATAAPAEVSQQDATIAVAADYELARGTSISTRVGGIFFLLSRIAELEIGEHLWCAGIAEGPAIARAFACLVPAELRDDPAFAIIAGPTPETADIPTWASTEALDKTLAALARRIARQGGDTGDVAARCSALFGSSLHEVLAAAIAGLVCERLEVPWSIDPVQALCVRAASISVTDDEILVELTSGMVDVAVRRAGLDFDPGWVPWLARRVRVVFPQEAW